VVESVDKEAYMAGTVSADSGFFSEEAVKAVIARRLKTAEGKKIYKKRKETAGPVFGIIKQEKRVPPVSAERA
jgi:hypothetical protein